MSKTVYKDYSASQKAKLYELHFDRLDKEGPQGDRNKYVCKIKSLQHHLDEFQMGDNDPSYDEADLSDSSNAHFEGYGLDTKDNRNRGRQGGPWKINKTKKLKNETPDNEYVGATLYASLSTVAAVCTMRFL